MPLDHEQTAVALALLLRSTGDVSLRGDQFMAPRLGAAWDALKRLEAEGRPLALAALGDEARLTTDEMIKIAEACDEPSTLGLQLDDLHVVCEAIADTWRDMTARAQIAEAMRSHRGADMLAEVGAAVQRLEADVSSEAISVETVAGEVYAEAVAMRDDPGSQLPKGIPTGLRVLDEKFTFGGFPRGQVTTVAGATSLGKSALVNTCLLGAARQGHDVLVVALEDDPRATTTRLISSLSRIGNRQLQRRVVAPSEWSRFAEGVSTVAGLRLAFLDRATNVSELCRAIRAHVRRHDTSLVVLDFLQLVRSGQRSRSAQEDVDHTFGEIVHTARGLDAATVVVSQLRRTRDAIPTKEDLYHSGSLEQWSHTIGILWRPELKGEPTPCVSLILCKQKNGPTGRLTLGWDPETVSFSDPDEYVARAYDAAVETFARTQRSER